MHKWLCRFILGFLYRIRIVGAERVSAEEGGVLFLPHFASSLDPLLAALFLPGNPRLALPAHLLKKWPRFLVKWINPVVLDPADGASLKEFIHHLKSGGKGILFPEGQPSANGGLMQILETSALIAEQSGAALIPVRIQGSEYTGFSLSAGTDRPYKCLPAITLRIAFPARMEFSPDAKGNARRSAAVRQIRTMMRNMMLATGWMRMPIFDSLLLLRKRWGGRRVMMIDADLTEINWNQFIARILLFCDFFQDKVSVGERVGVMLPNSAHTMSSILALQRLRSIPAMINYSMGTHGVIASCRTAKIRLVITSQRFLEAGKFLSLAEAMEAEGITLIKLEDFAHAVSKEQKLFAYIRGLFTSPAWDPGAENETALILFTSGSEGAPKGVALSHANIQVNSAQVLVGLPFTGKDRFLSCMPMFHAFGLCSGGFMPLAAGAVLILYPTPLHFKNIPVFAYTTRSTIIFGTNVFLNGYARNAEPSDFSSVRYVFCGGDKLQEATSRLWMEKFGIRILEGYGVTENSPVVAYNAVDYYRFGTVGILVPGMEARLEPVEGVTEGGRLFLRGPNVMQGYILSGEDELRTVPDGWYDTGDIVSIDDEGFITILGRAKRFAKVGGEMVSLTAVEEVIQKIWPDFVHAVVSIADENKGETLVLVTEMPGAKREDLRAAFVQRGFSEIMIPREIIYMEALPRIGSGKIDYTRITAMVLESSHDDKKGEDV